jgi:signal transduction histidine kinase
VSSLSTLLRTLVAVGAAVTAAAAVLGVILAARALRPVERMRREVDDISGARLDRRIAEGRPDELGRLARAFNRLLARAERATAEQQQFVADASHELRTPVTALQGHARIVVRAIDRGDLDQARESAEVVVGESRRLAGTIAELLSLAESAGPERPMEPVRLDRVAAEACGEMRAFHPGRPIEADLAETTVMGDAGRLGEVVRILVDNALKYSPEQTGVSVTVTPGGRPAVSVRDHGPGLSVADRERAFDRFYRGTASPGVSGSGLGLAIARTVCERHRAELTLDDAPGGGTVAVVRFPAPA